MDSDVFWFCNIDFNVRIKDFFEGKREREKKKVKIENGKPFWCWKVGRKNLLIGSFHLYSLSDFSSMNVESAAFHAGECRKQIKLSNTQPSSPDMFPSDCSFNFWLLKISTPTSTLSLLCMVFPVAMERFDENVRLKPMPAAAAYGNTFFMSSINDIGTASETRTAWMNMRKIYERKKRQLWLVSRTYYTEYVCCVSIAGMSETVVQSRVFLFTPFRITACKTASISNCKLHNLKKFCVCVTPNHNWQLRDFTTQRCKQQRGKKKFSHFIACRLEFPRSIFQIQFFSSTLLPPCNSQRTQRCRRSVGERKRSRIGIIHNTWRHKIDWNGDYDVQEERALAKSENCETIFFPTPRLSLCNRGGKIEKCGKWKVVQGENDIREG